MTREELISSPEYWITQMQKALYEAVEDYRTNWDYLCSDIAQKCQIPVSKVVEILDGEYKGTIEEYVKILVTIGKVPKIVIEELKDQK